MFPERVYTNSYVWPFPFIQYWYTDPASGIMTAHYDDPVPGHEHFPFGLPLEPPV